MTAGAPAAGAGPFVAPHHRDRPPADLAGHRAARSRGGVSTGGCLTGFASAPAPAHGTATLPSGPSDSAPATAGRPSWGPRGAWRTARSTVSSAAQGQSGWRRSLPRRPWTRADGDVQQPFGLGLGELAVEQ